jgi:hypothetical protein
MELVFLVMLDWWRRITGIADRGGGVTFVGWMGVVSGLHKRRVKRWVMAVLQNFGRMCGWGIKVFNQDFPGFLVFHPKRRVW